MKFTKPSWVMHKDTSFRGEQEKRVSIFSVHVHPDGSRIATGGLDAKVRIWSTKPILNRNSELSGRPPKSLSTLTMHTGPVLVVRWAHSGRWLASGSDDEIVMIWDLDPMARGKTWGSDEVNVEGWKPLKRLPGHESDVTDMAWSPGDRYLATVGLDSQILIWCGFTLERLRKIEQHQGFVKGVCWDPVGEFLATGSDDRSVRIWRTTDWGMEAEVRKPFDHSPGTFFRRLSWSPDGAHITASNATNNEGYVFIAAVIARNTWTSEISLVGHENTVEVAAYNPHIFLRDPSLPVIASNICSVVALGADDRAVSVWQTKSARPMIVAKEVFERQIMDLSWSKDGLTLYAVSSDGTLAVFDFDPDELEGIAPESAQEQYLKKFGFVPPPLPEGYSHQIAKAQSAARMTPPPSPGPEHSQTGFDDQANGGEHINKLVAKRKPKKRVQLTFAGVPSAGTESINTAGTTTAAPVSAAGGVGSASARPFSEVPVSATSISHRPPTSRSVASLLNAEPLPPTTSTFGLGIGEEDVDMFSMDMNTEVSINSLETDAQAGRVKRKAVESADDRVMSKPRTLGGDRVRETVSIREIAGSAATFGPAGGSLGLWSEPSSLMGRLQVPPVLTYLKANVEGSEDVFEGRNSEDGAGATEVLFVSGKQTQWLDYLPSPVIALAATTTFCAVAMQDGSVNVYSHTGRRLMPTLTIGSPCSWFSGNKNSLMLLTSSGLLHVWNVKKQVAVFQPTSVVPILGPSPNTTIISAAVRANGAPVFQLSTGVAHTWDPALSAWVKLSEPWWAKGSDAWQGRQRSNNNSATRGVVSVLESSISERISDEKPPTTIQRPAWWNVALTLGHLESKLHAAKALDSPQEYKQALLLLAKRIADEGFRGKAEELVKELFGPVYWRPGREDTWSPTLLGMAKRDLLKDVLAVFARSKTLTKLALDWQDMLKKASNEE
ncbi:WD40 repeat-like protein [Laetiporus sulphureus 93-53]|uniref:Protein HIR n=1 Tax=Laetiporus sulphureus 93-53 TaxID=1314785 RepID=A0A165EZ85_9APHY|nr:WD40 repeat-like protein [Laetiporus sulphureus 93-53]KZT08028.1 WD40 repeat-like protein [Laetiporus sulphureus 93-53]